MSLITSLNFDLDVNRHQAHMYAMNIIILLLCLFLPRTSYSVIYGTDDRQLISKSTAIAQKNATSIAIFVSKNFIHVQNDGSYNLETVPLKESRSLCSTERFKEQPSFFVACTGFLIAPDLLMTAGHCSVNFGEIQNERNAFCEDFIWLFDFNDLDGQVKTTGYQKDQFAECETIIHATHDSIPPTDSTPIQFKQDFALIKLKNKLSRPFLQLTSKTLTKDSQISMIGHPQGGPQIYSRGTVLKNHTEFYQTSLDSYEGNSGSPVFDQENKVFGLLVRGYPDSLIEQKGCYKSNRCSQDGTLCTQKSLIFSHGSQVQKIPAEIFKFLNSR